LTRGVGTSATSYGGGGHLNAGTCQVGNDESDLLLAEIVGKITADG